MASAQVRSIAILPFNDWSHGNGQDWFGDGITDEVIDDLARIPGLRVAAPTSAFSFHSQPRDLRRIGEQLGIAAVLEGEIRDDKRRLRATVELRRTEDGYKLWSAVFERPQDGAFQLEQDVVRALEIRIHAAAAPAGETRRPAPLAYETYLEGRAWFGHADSDSITKAGERFAAATELDPDFARAWAWQSMALEYGVDGGLARPNEAMPAARDAAERAAALAADSADAHLALGIVKLQYDWDWDAARQEFDRAFQLRPGSAMAQHWLAHWYETQGRLAEARDTLAGALALDPLSPELLHDAANERLAAKDPAGALPFAQKAADLLPRAPRAESSLVLALYEAGQKEKAQQAGAALLAAAGEQAAPVEAALCAAIEGDSSEALGLLDRSEDLHASQRVPATALARLAAAAGDWDRLFEWLDAAYDERSVQLPYARLDPQIPAADPRFVALLDRMKLPH